MRRILNLIVFLFITSLPLTAQQTNEYFKFELRFGPFKGGEAVFYSRDTLIEQQVYQKNFLNGYTTGLAEKLYSVNDCFESLLFPDNFLPVTAHKKLKEQNYRFNNSVYFDHETQQATSKHSGEQWVDANICDVSALFTYLRKSTLLEQLNRNDYLTTPFWDTDEWYYLKFKFTRKESIETLDGWVECIRLEPQEVSGRFFNKKNPINIWITADQRKLPVLMELNFSIGSVKCVLVDYQI